MANPHRGHVEIEADGKTYRLVFSTHALCCLEDATGLSVSVLGQQMADPKISLLRSMMWAALRDYHEDVSIRQAGDLMDVIGIAESGEALGRAFVLAFPQEEATDKPRPRLASKGGRG
jgi:hypothetical protein